MVTLCPERYVKPWTDHEFYSTSQLKFGNEEDNLFLSPATHVCMVGDMNISMSTERLYYLTFSFRFLSLSTNPAYTAKPDDLPGSNSSKHIRHSCPIRGDCSGSLYAEDSEHKINDL
ncbi:hypothetical protein NQZ79_g4069 [Umbelopsis isabellina]|nr:hypothetical protein NQZ79_g4069 [Umbelopsis isabellina]